MTDDRAAADDDAEAADGAADEPLTLAPPHQRAPRRPFPLAAATAPVAAAAVMWLITGSALMLLFAALGPLLAVATLVDGAWAERRLARRAVVDAGIERARAQRAVTARHERERTALRRRHPDAAALIARPGVVWSAAAPPQLVLGAGTAPSTVRVQGGGEPAAALRRQAATLLHAPVVLPASAGVCVVGPHALALAVARALVLQLCLTRPPHELAVVATPAGEHWARELPHRRTAGAACRLAFLEVGEQADAEIVIAVAAPGAPLPAGCAAVLTMTGVTTATLQHAHDTRELTVEGVSRGQAECAVALLARVAEPADVPAAVALGPLLAAAPGTGLAVPIGLDGAAPAIVDLVADGPHAVVAGVTGSGKSELLVTWITALCATRSTREVSFLLADFKGGTAFDALAALPHVTGVITDLDAAGARRAIQSLRAELRRREHVLATAGARDIADDRVRMPRLVIVVDEFAALLDGDAELHAVFTDVAARGRALGMHLVLGTQRAAGVVRDALLANCPLRISLRVTDPADSRALVGTDQAAMLPGGVHGLALLRRAGDASARPIRVALSSAAELALGAARPGEPAPHRPWLPALPARLTLAEAAELDRDAVDARRVVLGVVDEPERQRRTALTLTVGSERGLAVVGGPGAGKSTLLALIAAQLGQAEVRWIPPDEEAAWDALFAVHAAGAPGVVLIDDVDALAAAYPPDYAAAFVAQLERLARTAGGQGVTVVATAQRLAGAAARALELLPRRAVLAVLTRLEHVAAGADAALFDAAAPPGRACIGARYAQLALPDHASRTTPSETPAAPLWAPTEAVTAMVSRAPRRAAAAARAVWPGCAVVPVEEAAHADDRAGAAPMIVVGDGDGWQRHWPLLARLRDEHELLVDAECPAEFRLFGGRRELPPYARPGADRAWSVRAAEPVVRVMLPPGRGAHA